MTNANSTYLVAAMKKVVEELCENDKTIQRVKFVKLMSASLSEIGELITNSQAELRKEFEEKIEEVKTENTKLKNDLIDTRLKLEQNQQYINRDTIKICNIPEPKLGDKEFEDTNATVIKVLEKASINITEADISVSHRLPVRDSTKSKAIIVKFTRRDTRNTIIRQKKKLGDNEQFKLAYPDAYMVEHLTPQRAKAAYNLRNDKKIAKCWSVDGRLKVLKEGHSQDDKPININSLSDLTNVGWSQEAIEKLMMEK